MNRLAAFALSVLLASTPAFALDDARRLEVAGQWFDSLEAADPASLFVMLSADAMIELRDIGVTQTKEEFLESLPEWADAIAGGSIDWRPERMTSTGLEILACYRFTSGPVMTRETLDVSENAQILRSVQKRVGDDCAGF